MVLVPALFAVPRLVWVDDLSRLGAVDPELIEEDVRVRERVSQLETGRFIIALGDDAEEALVLNDQVHEKLQALVMSGDLGGIRSLHQMLWSTDLQSRNWQTLQRQEGLYERVDTVFRESGFRPGAFGAFEQDLSSPPPPPLTFADLRASELGPMLATTAFELGERFAIVTFLRGIRSFDAVREAVDGLEGAFVFEQREFVNQIYGEFRATTLRQVLVGSVLVAIVLVGRYRDWRRSLAALLPSIMVVVALLGGFSVFGIETNLLHVISLMMVMGMGVDYGVFLVDTFAEQRAFSATMLSLLLSCLTTVFVFGTLAISDHPALRAIGLTTGLGVLLAFVFAPLTLLLIGSADRDGDGHV
jgi:predicted exporter